MWNAPFLNGPSRGVAERVPSGAITSDVPSRSFCTAGASASRAFAGSERSMNATPARRKNCPKPGTLAASFFATPVKSLRSSFATTIVSSLLWWLKTNTHGRADHRCSAPETMSMSMPATARPRSEPTPPVTFTIVRRDRRSSPIAAPA
jgi:hypothetical protein